MYKSATIFDVSVKKLVKKDQVYVQLTLKDFFSKNNIVIARITTKTSNTFIKLLQPIFVSTPTKLSVIKNFWYNEGEIWNNFIYKVQ